MYTRRIIDDRVKLGQAIVFDFDTFEEVYDEKSMVCSVSLYNGEKPVESLEQKPIEQTSLATLSPFFNCVKPNKVLVPATLDFQILTYRFVFKMGDKTFNYCTDMFVSQGTNNPKFFSLESAQAYLDELEKYKGIKNETGLWVIVIGFGVLLVLAMVWCLVFCCQNRVRFSYPERTRHPRRKRPKEPGRVLSRSGIVRPILT